MFSTRAELLEKNPPREVQRVITTLKSYPAYKDPGVPWLGQVPEHWEVVPLKRLAWFKSGAGFPVHHQGDASAEIPFFKVSDMNIPGNEKYLRVCANTVSTTVAQGLGATVFPAGTIVFPKVGGALLTNKRRIAANQCCIDNNMMACVARNGNREFLFLVMSYIDLGQFAQPGPVPAISEGEVREIRVALPSAAEQTAIVRFLDWADRRIRRYIRAKQKLIKLLEEYKQALIHQAVTGKIDVRTGQPYPVYKPSGVEWLGQVPAHWEVRRLGVVTQILNGATPLSSRPEYWDGDIVWVTPDDLGKLKDRYIDNSSRRITQEGYNACGTTLAPAGSIVLSTRAPIGHLGILRVAACVNQGCRLLVPQAATASEFLYHVLVAARPSLEVLGQGSTFMELSRSKLSIFPIPFPPLLEQTAIAEYLDAQTAKLDAVIAAARREIDLLREYRTRLIADVVTGKVDVREVAARLPEEPPEEEIETMETDETADGEATNDASAEAFPEEEV